MLRSFQMIAAGVLALAALSCSPPNKAVPKGAVRIAPSTGNCGIGPYRVPADGTITTATQPGTRIQDGSGGASVTCSVQKTGDGYQIEAEIQQGSTSASLFGSVSPGEAPAEGNDAVLGFYHPDSTHVEGTACRLSVSAGQRIQPGAVWGTVSCVDARKPSTGQTCNVAMDFVFENCSK